MRRVPARAAAAGSLACAVAAAAACGVIPSPAPELDENFIPSIAPSFTPDSLAGGDGFTVEEQVAVRLRVTTCDGWATGSGWILDQNRIVTNAHVIASASQIEVTTYEGRNFTATESAIAPVADLGLVTIDGQFPASATYESKSLNIQEKITVVGYPDGQELTTEQGLFLGLTADTVGNSGESVWNLRVHVEPGSSGSPVFDQSGNVVATIFAGDEATGALAWPVDWLIASEEAGDWKPNPPTC